MSIRLMLARVKRGYMGWAVLGLVVMAASAMYWLNPFHTALDDPRARIFGFTAYRMPSRSMEPTVFEGSFFLCNVAAIRNRDPRVGEIIVFRYPPNPNVHYIKRVVASGGSTFEMRKGVVFLDGERLAEPWLPAEPITEIDFDGRRIQLEPDNLYADFPPTPIPAHHFFVLGDSRGNSEDSRAWGLVPRENVIGTYVRLF